MKKLVHYVDTASFGGMEQTVATLIEHLDTSTFENVLAHHGSPELRQLVARAEASGAQSWVLPDLGDGLLHSLPAFVAKLRSESVDIFHAHLNWPLAGHRGIAAAAVARIPAICVSEHAFVPIPWRTSVALERLLSACIDRYIAVSHAVAAKLIETFSFLRPKVEVVYSGVALERFDVRSTSHKREELTRGRERPVILAAGRLDEQKGHAYLLEAARLLPDVVVAIAGDGPMRTGLQEQARTLGDRALVLGPRDDIPDLLAACDVFVQPSASFEGLGLGALEAMAAGKPVIVTSAGAGRELVRNGESGLVVPPADAAALGAAIRTLLSDSGLARRCAAYGRSRVRRRFSAVTMAERFSAIYHDLLRRRMGRGGPR